MAIYGKCLPSAQRSSVLEEGAQASHRTQLLGSSSEISTQETPGPASEVARTQQHMSGLGEDSDTRTYLDSHSNQHV